MLIQRSFAILSITFLLFSCSQKPVETTSLEVERNPSAVSAARGNDWDYDPGAPKDSKWADLFAETPNYRAYGSAVIGGKGDKFRWMMGPMWYRGRLGKNQVKVFVIGQEGAQDENVSNRSFTGSTGTRMQKFLNYLGVDRSYLFMNTFVYTITGQYGLAQDAAVTAESKNLMWLAQNENSVVVTHRHKLFDYMLEQNKGTLALVIGVGTAGKDSAASWVRAHGGDCTASQLSKGCDGVGKLAGIKVVGVMHPGAASARNGGDDAALRLRADFKAKAAIVASKLKENPNWLPQDPGMKRDLSLEFAYGDAAIPHRDFPFGTNWRMGQDGTASNRRGADGIQIYSKKGCYNNVNTNPQGRCDETAGTKKLMYEVNPSLLTAKPAEMKAGDVPYESPKNAIGRKEFDEGPGADLAKMILEFFNQDYAKLGVTSHISFGPNGSYRGRANAAKILVVADQESHDDMFSGRALTGTGGQLFQSFLNAIGATKSYFILRTLPVDTLDLSVEKRLAVATDAKVSDARRRIIESVLSAGKTKVIFTIGPVAQKVVSDLGDLEVKVVNLPEFSDKTIKEVKSVISKVKDLGLTIDVAGKFDYAGTVSIIPRLDLPAYTRFWMGTSGSRAVRAYEVVDGKKVYNPDYYIFKAPQWATKWPEGALSAEEKASVEAFKSQQP